MNQKIVDNRPIGGLFDCLARTWRCVNKKIRAIPRLVLFFVGVGLRNSRRLVLRNSLRVERVVGA